MDGGNLNEAYERFHRTGPEWGENQLTNHGPMAAEVLVRRGHGAQLTGWVDAYARRLDDLPAATNPVTDLNWRTALGQRRRLADWTTYFTRQLDEQPWRDVLATWWPCLLPGIVAGTTHGVIRVGHVVRVLLVGVENPQALAELAHGLAFWAAWSQPVPPAAAPAGVLDPLRALDALPRIPDQQGNVAARLGQLSDVGEWSASVAALRPATNAEDARTRLTDLVTGATQRYLTHGHGSPVLLVHTATAPNAVLHTLPALPDALWAPSLTAVWTATAAVFSAYAPTDPLPASALPEPATQTGSAVADVLDRAVDHGDEHVIKFTDTAAEVYTRTGDTRALDAAVHASGLIASSR